MSIVEREVSPSKIAFELQGLQRQRTWYLKSRIMVANRLQATVAGADGYYSGMKEKERQKAFVNAAKTIKAIVFDNEEHELTAMVNTTWMAINGFDEQKILLEAKMLSLARALPIASWVLDKPQRGYGLHMMAVTIGETGDLANYSNPAKVWKRMGCAPYTKEDKTAMGSTWRFGKEGKLTAKEWAEFGYSPRRRSIAYVIGEGLIKLNKDGPYRTRYDDARETFLKRHPDYSKGRCHYHGMLCATKLLLKNLWLEWNDVEYKPYNR